MKTHSIRTLRRTAVVLVTGVAAAALAACATGDDSAEATPGGSMTDGVDTVRIVMGPIIYEPVQIAIEDGLFAEQGLEIELVEGGDAASNLALLVSGQVDIAHTSSASIIQAASQGLAVRAVLGALSNDPDAEPTSGLVALPDSGISGYGDLGGRTVAMQGLNSSTHMGVLLGAAEAGVDVDTITFVDMPLPNLNNAVLSGDVDAAFPLGPFFPAALESGLALVADPASDVLAYSPVVLYAAADGFVEENEDIIRRFQAAVTQAHAIAREDDFARVRQVQIETTDQDSALIESAVITGYQTDQYRNGWETTLEGMYELGFIADRLTVDDVLSPLAPLGD